MNHDELPGTGSIQHHRLRGLDGSESLLQSGITVFRLIALLLKGTLCACLICPFVGKRICSTDGADDTIELVGGERESGQQTEQLSLMPLNRLEEGESAHLAKRVSLVPSNWSEKGELKEGESVHLTRRVSLALSNWSELPQSINVQLH